MGPISTDDEGNLVYMEKGGPSNLSFEPDKDKEVAPQEQQNLLLEQISSMTPTKGETFHAYWERFMALLDAYPNYDHDLRSLLDQFYWGMTIRIKLVNFFSGGSLFNKNPKEAMELLAAMAISTQ